MTVKTFLYPFAVFLLLSGTIPAQELRISDVTHQGNTYSVFLNNITVPQGRYKGYITLGTVANVNGWTPYNSYVDTFDLTTTGVLHFSDTMVTHFAGLMKDWTGSIPDSMTVWVGLDSMDVPINAGLSHFSDARAFSVTEILSAVPTLERSDWPVSIKFMNNECIITAKGDGMVTVSDILGRMIETVSISADETKELFLTGKGLLFISYSAPSKQTITKKYIF